jgi:Flp pilus assembly protein TadG
MVIVGSKRKRISSPGVAAVEMAVTLPLVLALLIGTWEVGRILEIEQILNMGAREAARQAGSGLLTDSQVQQVAIDYIRNALDDTTGNLTRNLAVTVTVYPASSPTTPENIDASQANSLDLIVVSVSIPYQDVRWIALPTITGAQSLQAQATWVCLKDYPFPTTAPQPPTG